jgi:hypothetical protein
MQNQVHRRAAETQRKTKARSKPESAEVAEDAEGYRPGVPASQWPRFARIVGLAKILAGSSTET